VLTSFVQRPLIYRRLHFEERPFMETFMELETETRIFFQSCAVTNAERIRISLSPNRRQPTIYRGYDCQRSKSLNSIWHSIENKVQIQMACGKPPLLSGCPSPFCPTEDLLTIRVWNSSSDLCESVGRRTRVSTASLPSQFHIKPIKWGTAGGAYQWRPSHLARVR
jgi:hypothetical protein